MSLLQRLSAVTAARAPSSQNAVRPGCHAHRTFYENLPNFKESIRLDFETTAPPCRFCGLTSISLHEWMMQGCSATSGQLTFLGYNATCLFASGFSGLILRERVDLEPRMLARGFGEHLLCLYTEGDRNRRRALPSL